MATGVALLVLDMQNDICDFAGRNEHLQRLIASIRATTDWARASKIPVIYSRVAYRPSYVDVLPRVPQFVRDQHILDETRPGSAIVDELAPQPGDIDILRRRVSAFYGTDLEVVLRGLKANTLLLTGMSTARVVESTARDANDRDYRAVVISDACGADTPEKHENALKSIADFFGEVITFSEAKQSFS